MLLLLLLPSDTEESDQLSLLHTAHQEVRSIKEVAKIEKTEACVCACPCPGKKKKNSPGHATHSIHVVLADGPDGQSQTDSYF